ncbi:MAG: methyltransferase domain-containing protein [Halobacteriales archaeon]|nr:methyltransferase domain-containing protein [Halobacteriales archaeon]
MPISDPESYYDEHDEYEWERLTRSLHGRLEWSGSIKQLETHLPPSGRILDAGGGAGRYTVWLAEQGYEVMLIEPSEGQRQVAKKKIADRGVKDKVTVREGDIRDLSANDGRFDATLCLGGPLSHVFDANERETAVTELSRVTVSNGPIFVSVMGRLNFLSILLIEASHLDLLPEFAEIGDYNRDLLDGRDAHFTETHFFRAEEFESLLNQGGLTVETLVGLEGLASLFSAGRLRETANNLSEEQQKWIDELVNNQREDSTVVDLSAHMLAVCQAIE